MKTCGGERQCATLLNHSSCHNGSGDTGFDPWTPVLESAGGLDKLFTRAEEDLVFSRKLNAHPGLKGPSLTLLVPTRKQEATGVKELKNPSQA
ncbi:hypothetical protein WISP_47380 [Willisornis vidua]|uniref:Uncharacterized protein n=1 Tax=Willisornis vidua TaxID=1566151 RepID=A0ABQ9DJJ1_9PASS|nr:hypothetical protein WISP_47380 [Willisornis vidua]